MRVDISCDAFTGVVESVLDDLHWDAGFEGDRRPAVSKRVEADLRDLLFRVVPVVAALGSFEFAAEAFGVKIVAVGSSED